MDTSKDIMIAPHELLGIPELLSPAGSWDSLVAAVAAGADAVYLGGKRFQARMMADNFDESDLVRAVEYAHLAGVRVYVTVNTLIGEEELEDMAHYLLHLYSIGVDALLIQDLGVLRLAQDLIPQMPLHASTQMTIHNLPGIIWASKNGFQRVVLAREMTLEEVSQAAVVARRVNVGLEVFVHGALCYSYSGQCRLSSMIGGRSGNRGLCAQPCRKPYRLVLSSIDRYGRPEKQRYLSLKNSYLLSTRDLALYPYLPQLVAARIQALKIEGRMRSPEYVAVVTSIYRRALDGIAGGGWRPDPLDMRDLALAFNREFTGGHLMHQEVMARDMPHNRGLLLGVVVGYDPGQKEALVQLKGDLIPQKGDGLLISWEGVGMGTILRRTPKLEADQIHIPVPGSVAVGAQVRLTSQQSLDLAAQGIMSRELSPRVIDAQLTWDEAVPVMRGGFRGPGGIPHFEIRAAEPMERAVDRPLTVSQIETQLRRTGGTPFVLGTLKMDYPGGLYAPLSSLNQLRRDFLKSAGDALIASFRPPQEGVQRAVKKLRTWSRGRKIEKKDTVFRRPSLGVYVQDLESTKAALDGGADRVYLEPLMVGNDSEPRELIDVLEDILEICPPGRVVIWKWPLITRDRELQLLEKVARKTAVTGVMVEGVGALHAAFKLGIDLWGGIGLNVWNSQTLRDLSTLRQVTLSPELSRRQIAALALNRPPTPALEVMVQGNLEAMATEDDLTSLVPSEAPGFIGLADEYRTFPLRKDDQGRIHIHNSVETCLLDHLPSLAELGLEGVAVEARGKPAAYARELAGIYSEALSLLDEAADPPQVQEKLQQLKERVKALSLGGITTGPFLRGLREG